MEEKSRAQELSVREISLIRELTQIRKEHKRELEYEMGMDNAFTNNLFPEICLIPLPPYLFFIQPILPGKTKSLLL